MGEAKNGEGAEARPTGAAASETEEEGLFCVAEGVGEPVLLIHGLTLDHRMWRPQMGPLLSAGYRVIRYDVRGFGRSQPLAGSSSVDADDVPRLLDRLGVMRAHLVGLSMGGAIAADVGIHHGNRVASIVFADAALGGMKFRGEYRAINARNVALARSEGVEAAKEAWLRSALFAPARRNADVRDALIEMVKGYSGAHWRSGQRALHSDTYGRIGEIRAPSLVLVGQLDSDDFQSAADWLASQIVGAKKVVIEGAGHMSNMERPEAFNTAVLEFLAENR